MAIFKITGMTCGHCTAAVEKALLKVAGVEGVKVTLDPGGARVEGSADPGKLIAAIVEEGYNAQSID